MPTAVTFSVKSTLASSTGASGASAYTLSASGLKSGALYVLALSVSDAGGFTAAPPTLAVTGCSLTWTAIEDTTGAAVGLAWFRGQGTPTDGTISIDVGAVVHDSCEAALIECLNVTDNSDGGASAVVQHPESSSSSIATLSVTLATFADATFNGALACFVKNTTAAVTEEAGWTKLVDVNDPLDAPTRNFVVISKSGGSDLTPSISWTGNTSARGLAIEVANGSGGGVSSTLSNYFEGSTVNAGVTVGNSGTVGSNAFDAVQADVGASLIYTDLYVPNGDRAMYVDAGANTGCYAEWSSFPTSTHLYGRAYIHFTEFPTANEQLIWFMNGASQVCSLGINTDGKVRVYDATGATAGTSTAALFRAKKVRIEWDITFNAATGAATIKLFNILDSTTVTETLSLSSKNFGAQATAVRIGRLVRSGAFAYTVDSLNVNTTALPGPTAATYGGKPNSMTWTFANSGLHGGGQMNALAFDPTRNGVVMGMGDVAGIVRSTDHGVNWQPVNSYLFTNGRGKSGAALGVGPTNGNWYFVSGTLPTAADFWRSTDGGATITNRFTGSGPFVDAQDGSPLPTWPRGVGRLIVVDDATGTENIYVGTRDSGVWRSTNGGTSWTQGWALAAGGGTTYYIRTLIADPTDPTTLYAGCFNAGSGGGIYKITGGRTATSTVTKLAGSNAPSGCEELFILGSTLYAACYTQGARSIPLTPGGATAWTVINTGLDITAPAYHGLTGHVVGAAHTLFIGCYNSSGNGDGASDSVYKSTNNGTSWTGLTAANINSTLAGTTSEWWYITETPGNPNLFGHNNYVTNQLETDPFNNQRVMCGGRHGAWGTADNGTTWFPHMRGLPLTVDNGVWSDPGHHVGIIGTNSDHTAHGSDNNYADLTFRMPTAFGPDGLGLGFDPFLRPPTLYMGHGGTGSSNGNVDGQVHKNVDWFNTAVSETTGGWTDTNLDVLCGGKRPVAIAVGRDAANQTIVLAAVDEYGMVRKVGTAGWANTTNGLVVDGLGTLTTEQWYSGDIAWPVGSQYVYYIDRDQGGLHRSTDYGASWSRIWTANHATFPFGSGDRYNHVAIDPFDEGFLYVSVKNGLYKIANAKTGTVNASITPVEIGSPAGAFSRPGPVSVNKWGWVFLHEFESDSVAPKLWLSMDQGTTWSDVTDNYYANSTGAANRIAITENNFVYVSNRGLGINKGAPSSSSSSLGASFAGQSSFAGTLSGTSSLTASFAGVSDFSGTLSSTIVVAGGVGPRKRHRREFPPP